MTGTPAVRELRSGEDATFGRGAPGLPVDLQLHHPAVSRLAGRIRAHEDYWLISNLSNDRTYAVENPEGGGERVKIAPRRLGMPVPFEFARVVIPVEGGGVSFLIFTPQHTFLDPMTPSTSTAELDGTLSAFPMDESAKYFLVLVALCEPRLRDSASTVLPSVPDIVRRLSGHPECTGLTRRAVAFHIDYLARRKLRVRERNPS